jgi:predicted PurR-regulated permease PerM
MSPGAREHVRFDRRIGAAAGALLLLACLLILRPFISAALWAAILCFSTWPAFLKLQRAVGGRKSLAAFIAILTLAAIIVVPFAILAVTAAGNVADLFAAAQKLIRAGAPSLPDWLTGMPFVGRRLNDYWNGLVQSHAVRAEELAKWLPLAKRFALRVARMVGNGVFQIVLSLLIAFFFYRDGNAIGARFSAIIERVGGLEGRKLLGTAEATVRSVVYGVLGTALVQGVLAALGFLIAGVPGFAFLGFVTSILSPVPGGPLLVALGSAFWLLRESSINWAIFIAIWGLIVSSLDHIVRPVLITRGGSTTPLILVMLGLFGGAAALGLIGLFIGPTLLAVGYRLLESWSYAATAASAETPAVPRADHTPLDAQPTGSRPSNTGTD